MWIFDLTRNMPSSTASTTDLVKAPSSQKRKRTADDESKEERLKYNSGAGGLIPASQTSVSMGTKIRKIEGKNLNNAQWVDVEKHRLQQRNDDDDVDGTETGNPFLPTREPDFAHLRRELADDEGSINGLLTNGDNASKRLTNGDSHAVVVANGTNADGEVSQKEASPIFWHSHKFRDILGVVPLGSQSGTPAKEAVELAVVERPMWDLDLGDRYVKDYE
jgi:U3 small nucleolar RNA-associated protein 4